MRPYLDSKFSLKKAQVLPRGVVWGSPRGTTFQKWMYTWPNQLTMFHASGAPCDMPCNAGPSSSIPIACLSFHQHHAPFSTVRGVDALLSTVSHCQGMVNFVKH